MNFSDILRMEIEKIYDLDLSEFVWDEKLTHFLMGITLNDLNEHGYEDYITTMAEVYEKGFNIGLCRLTCRYFAKLLPESKLIYGALPILKGTKNSLFGKHAWIVDKGYIYDPTLKLIIPEEKAQALGYNEIKTLAAEAARYFTDDDVYSKYMPIRERNIENFNKELLMIKLD